jgi:hypothetical protein
MSTTKINLGVIRTDEKVRIVVGLLKSSGELEKIVTNMRVEDLDDVVRSVITGGEIGAYVLLPSVIKTVNTDQLKTGTRITTLTPSYPCNI